MARRRRPLTLAVLALLSLTLLTLDYRGGDGAPFSGLRSATQDVFGPGQRAVGVAVSPLTGLAHDVTDGLAGLGRSRRREQRLRRDNQLLRRQLRAAQLDRAATEQLRRLDLLAGQSRYRVLPGRVVALGPTAGLEWTATVDLGSREGVREGMTVVNGDGLVGRVKRPGALTSVVLLAVDPLSAVGSRATSGQLGLLRGAGLRPLRLQLLDPLAPLAVGDRLVTGPYGATTYASGIPVGTVSAVTRTAGALDRTADVRPYVDFSALDVIGVVVAPQRTSPPASAGPPKRVR